MCLGVPGRVSECLGEIDGLAFAVVEFAGLHRRICTSCVPEAAPGDYVLVHAGIAITRIDAAEAERTLQLLRELGEADQVSHEVP